MPDERFTVDFTVTDSGIRYIVHRRDKIGALVPINSGMTQIIEDAAKAAARAILEAKEVSRA